VLLLVTLEDDETTLDDDVDITELIELLELEDETTLELED